MINQSNKIKPVCELRHGEWEKTLNDIEFCNSIITDPPYSPKTHSGFIDPKTYNPETHKNDGLGYESIDEESCIKFCEYWVPRVKDWFVIFGDHISASWWRKTLNDFGLYVFAPVYYINKMSVPRINGDGPCSSGETITRAATKEYVENYSLSIIEKFNPELFNESVDSITVARHKYKPKTLKSRPGWYPAVKDSNSFVKGQKSVETMCRIIQDYSEPYDIIVDPFAGSGTTLLAAKMMDRSSIGSEARKKVCDLARKRLTGPSQLSML